MATKDALHCSVITPEQQVLDANATSVVLPAHDGQIGILKDRAPLLCELGTGVLRVDTQNDGIREIYVDGGFAQVLHNEVTVLTERAADAENISKSSAQKALADAEKMLMKDIPAVENRNHAIARAKAQLAIARK